MNQNRKKKTYNPNAKSVTLLAPDKDHSLFKLRIQFLRGSIDVHGDPVPPRTLTYYSKDTPAERESFHNTPAVFEEIAKRLHKGEADLVSVFLKFGGFKAQSELIERFYRQINLGFGRIYLNRVYEQLPTGDHLPMEFYHRRHDYEYVGGKWRLPVSKQALKTYYIDGAEMTKEEKQAWVRLEYERQIRELQNVENDA